MMRIFKKFRKIQYPNQKFTRNIILHYGNAHAIRFRNMLVALGGERSLDIGANLLAATQIYNNLPNNSFGIASCLVLENHPKHSLIVEILRSTLSRSNHIQLMG